MKTTSERKKILFVVLFLLLLTLIFFWKIVFLHQTFFIGDIISFNYPLRAYISSSLKEGHLPLWTPYICCGFPLLAEGEAGLFYPLNFTFLLSPALLAYNYSVIFHFFLGGFFLYLFLKALKLESTSCLIGAVTFAFSGLFVTHIYYLNMLSGYIWLPLILFFIERGIKRERFSYFLFAGVVLGIEFLGSHPQIALQVLGIVFFYLIFRGFSSLRRKTIPVFLLILIIGLSLAAIQLLPTYELTRYSIRGVSLPYQEWTKTSFPLKYIITFLLPNFYGAPFIDTYFGPFNYFDLCTYLGILPLILAGIGIGWRRDRLSFFFFFLAILSLFLALGKYNPGYRLLYHLPLLKSLRGPGRYLYLYSFSLPILAALGFDYLTKSKNTFLFRKTLLFFGLFFLLIFILASLTILLTQHSFLETGNFSIETINRIYLVRLKDLFFFLIMVLSSLGLFFFLERGKVKLFKTLALLLIIFNLFSFGIRFNPTLDRDLFSSQPKSLQFLKKDKGIHRIANSPPDAYRGKILCSCITNLEPYPKIIKGFTENIEPNLPLLYRISHVAGYISLRLRRHEELVKICDLRLTGLLNCKYFLSTKEAPFLGALVFTNRFVNIYRNKNFLSRAFIVHQIEVIKDEKKILKRLREPTFDLKRCIILEEGSDLEMNPSSLEGSKAEIIEYSPREMVIKADLIQNGFLFLSDTYYPGWKVYVDGKREKIYRADYLFRAVSLKEGSHLVRFVYRPLTFYFGAGISLFMLLLLTLTIPYLICKERFFGK